MKYFRLLRVPALAIYGALVLLIVTGVYLPGRMETVQTAPGESILTDTEVSRSISVEGRRFPTDLTGLVPGPGGIGASENLEVSGDSLGFAVSVEGYVASFTYTGDSCAVVFAWDLNGNGETDSVSRNPKYHYGKLGPGSYRITLRYGGGRGKEPCAGYYTREVVIDK